MTTTTAESPIPVLDLRDLARPAERVRLVDALGRALTEVGFFALRGHGIPDEEVAALYDLALDLFLLPDEVKARHERPALMGQRGYTRFGREHARDHAAPDLKEYFSVGPDLPPDACPYPPNVWPEEAPALRAAALGLFARLEAVAEQVLEVAATYLGEPPRRFADLIRGGDSLLRIIHYPPLPADADPQSVRAAAHEDINFITLLAGATDDGLEVLTNDRGWQPVKAVPGQLVVNVGDMLQHLTNGALRSTTHRVVNPGDSRARRFSMPFFVHPRPDVDLTPLPSCVARQGGPRFGPLTAGAFLRARLEEIGLRG
ncbi:MAG: isopenicillin N synthase family oxygenase [Planctomycetes bacterium]|nr:isopenicillin N synthase family oxygenase [Planctomycetota bacterium]